jgi:uncharacterized protein YciI
MSGLPDGMTSERVFVVEGHYAPDAAERRIPVRREHLARVAEGQAGGRVLLAGGFDDMSRSLLVLRADDEAEARAWADADVYVRSGVWTAVDVRPFNAVLLDAAAR